VKRYRVGPGRYVPTDPNGEPSLCRCKPWQLCGACGLIEHRGSFCSWCRSTTALEVLDKRPVFSVRAVRTAKAASRAV